MTPVSHVLFATLIGLFTTLANAQNVEVKDAWVRPTVAGQKGTGGFMKITAQTPLTLVGVSSPVAGVAEVHEMKMDGDVMRMRAVPSLALPAGKTVELKPGGFHLMLMDLKQPLAKDSTVPVTLLFKDAQGKPSELALKLPVAIGAPGMPASAGHGHKH